MAVAPIARLAAIAPSETVTILRSSLGSRCQASTRAPNTAMPEASAKMKVTSVAKSSWAGTKPQADIDSVPIVPPTMAAASAEISRKITTWRGRSKGYGVPAKFCRVAAASSASRMPPMPVPMLASAYMGSVVSGSSSSGKPLKNWPRKTAGRMRGPRIAVAAKAMPDGG